MVCISATNNRDDQGTDQPATGAGVAIHRWRSLSSPAIVVLVRLDMVLHLTRVVSCSLVSPVQTYGGADDFGLHSDCRIAAFFQPDQRLETYRQNSPMVVFARRSTGRIALAKTKGNSNKAYPGSGANRFYITISFRCNHPGRRPDNIFPRSDSIRHGTRIQGNLPTDQIRFIPPDTRGILCNQPLSDQK